MGEGRRSYFELWHEKAGLLERSVEETEAMAWGNRLEEPIAREIAKVRGWRIRKVQRHLTVAWSDILPEPGAVRRHPDSTHLRADGDLDLRREAADYPLGASLDFEVAGSSIRDGRAGWVPLEIKAVGRYAARAWENGQPPLAVLLQVQGQLPCARAPLGVVGGLRSVTGPADVAEIPYHEPTVKLIFRAILDLELSLAHGEAPAPDLERVRDVEVVIALHKAVTPGKVLDLRGDPKVERLLGDYRSIAEVKGCAEKEAKRLWAELLHHLGPEADFDEIIANESRARRWTVPETEVAYLKKAYTSYGVYRRKT
jgi:predicted phage-related endonuclease